MPVQFVAGPILTRVGVFIGKRVFAFVVKNEKSVEELIYEKLIEEGVLHLGQHLGFPDWANTVLKSVVQNREKEYALKFLLSLGLPSVVIPETTPKGADGESITPGSVVIFTIPPMWFTDP